MVDQPGSTDGRHGISRKPLSGDWLRSLAVIGAAVTGVTVTTMLLAFVIVGGWSSSISQGDGSPSSAGSAGVPTTGIGGALTLTGDRTATMVLNRETMNDRGYALTGRDGQILFSGHPATISRIQYDGLEFFLDPADCAYTPGERDDATGLAPVELSCDRVGDVRDTATISVVGMLRLPADQAGVRGALPPTGGHLTVGDETLTFEVASLDLRRPEVIEIRPGFTSRFPVVYPVSVSSPNQTLEFEYAITVPSLRLIAFTLEDRRGEVAADGCAITYQRLAELSPRVSVVEMTLDCANVELEGAGGVALGGSLVVDIAEFPPIPLQ